MALDILYVLEIRSDIKIKTYNPEFMTATMKLHKGIQYQIKLKLEESLPTLSTCMASCTKGKFWVNFWARDSIVFISHKQTYDLPLEFIRQLRLIGKSVFILQTF